MTHDIYLPPSSEHTFVPDTATVDAHITGTDQGELLLEVDMVGTDNRRLVLAMSGPVAEVRADLDTLRSALERAAALMEQEPNGPEFLAKYGLGGI